MCGKYNVEPSLYFFLFFEAFIYDAQTRSMSVKLLSTHCGLFLGWWYGNVRQKHLLLTCIKDVVAIICRALSPFIPRWRCCIIHPNLSVHYLRKSVVLISVSFLYCRFVCKCFTYLFIQFHVWNYTCSSDIMPNITNISIWLKELPSDPRFRYVAWCNLKIKHKTGHKAS